MTTLEQRMAIQAHDRVTAVKQGAGEYKQKYGTMAHKLPILIHSAGLAQALAFVESRDKSAHYQLLTDLAATIELPGITSREELARRSRSAELDEYMFLTRRVVMALTWYKRFVESILKIQAGADDDRQAVTTGGEE